MLVKDVMVKNVISVSPEDTLSRAVAKMKNNRIHQLVILDNNEIKGILELKNIIIRNLDYRTTKVKNFISHITTISSDKTTEEAAKILLQTGSRALPVVDNKLVGIISETDLIEIVENNYNAQSVMTECKGIDKNDNIGSVQRTMVNQNISRVPVLDDDNLIGVIDTLDLIKIFESREKLRGGRLKERGVLEKLRLVETPVENVMRESVIIDKNTKLKDISLELQKNEEVFVKDKGKIFIITPKDILEIIASKPERGVYVQITNLKGEDSFVQGKIDKATTSFVQKIGKFVSGLESFFVHIEKHQKGGKIKYSVRTRVLTPFGLFVSKAWGWNLATTAQEAMNKLERGVLKKYNKIKARKRVKL